MIDLTAITTPFGLLDKETQDALRMHGGPYEGFTGDQKGGWTDVAIPGWVASSTYRVKPQPPKPREVVVCYHESGNTVVLTDEIRALDHGWTMGVNAFLFREVV